jgi:hypothetical protein
MNTTLVIVLITVVVLAIVGWLVWQRQRTDQLRQRFGPEYHRAVENYGDPTKAARALEAREKRVEQLNIHPLTPEDQTRFADAWRTLQARFVDNPTAAIREADGLVGEVMQARGYLVGDFEQRAADISVDHAEVVDNYRIAHEIAARNERGEASTEDLRQATLAYRALFEDLLETQVPAQREVGQ